MRWASSVSENLLTKDAKGVFNGQQGFITISKSLTLEISGLITICHWNWEIFWNHGYCPLLILRHNNVSLVFFLCYVFEFQNDTNITKILKRTSYNFHLDLPVKILVVVEPNSWLFGPKADWCSNQRTTPAKAPVNILPSTWLCLYLFVCIPKILFFLNHLRMSYSHYAFLP